jgi:Lrp/AsnC family transcriptional regulator for asnA, asnC and gidA
VDKLDVDIISNLQIDGRLTNVALARLLGVTERTVHNRLTKLLNNGVIDVVAIPNQDAIGYPFTGIVAMEVEPGKTKAVAAELCKHPNVTFVASLTGRYDLIVILVARTAREFTSIAEDFVAHIPGALGYETFFVPRVFKGGRGVDVKRIISSTRAKAEKTEKK